MEEEKSSEDEEDKAPQKPATPTEEERKDSFVVIEDRQMQRLSDYKKTTLKAMGIKNQLLETPESLAENDNPQELKQGVDIEINN